MIGPATTEQVPQIVGLWHECGLTRPWNDPEADALRALAGPSSTILVAAETDVGPSGLDGTVMAGFDGHRGWIYYLAVAPSRRRSGLGSALLASAEQWLAVAGAPKVELMVRADNAELLPFYRALGYTNQDVAVMGKFLDPALQKMWG